MTKIIKKVWVLGYPRSGTTWISDLINHDNSYKCIFEPFHHKLGIKEFIQMSYRYYEIYE